MDEFRAQRLAVASARLDAPAYRPNNRALYARFDAALSHRDNAAMAETITMQCMEVWGGNQAVDCGVVMAGLDAWVYSRPFGDSSGGGDVHYVSSCATGRITRLLLADVSGHGQTVSDTAANLRRLMRRFVNFIDQTQFVRSMNGELAKLNSTGSFATAVVTTFFAPTSRLAVCNAGHPAPFVYRPSTGEWSVLESNEPDKPDKRRAKPVAYPAHPEAQTNFPLGIIERTEYEQFATRLSVGDLVLCYTDALIECRDESGELLGLDGLLKTLRELDVSDPADIVPALVAALQRKSPKNLSEDDVTILLFRANGLGQRLSFWESLRGGLIWVRGVLRALLPGGGPVPWPKFSVPNLGGAVSNRLGRRDAEST